MTSSTHCRSAYSELAALYTVSCLRPSLLAYVFSTTACHMPDAPPFVDAPPPLLFVVGKGGVGKTTCAAATALWQARHSDAPVLLLSTDPAHSLADRLAGTDTPDTLHVDAFDARKAVNAFRDSHRDTLHEIVARGTFFDDDDIQELLDLALPGIDEAMAVLRIEKLLSADAYASIIVDTAPTGHTLRLFEMPERFQTWIDFLDVLLEKHRYMRARFSGHTASDALDTFVYTLRDRVERVMSTLRTADQAGALVVTQAEPAITSETNRLINRLQQLSVSPKGVVINQWSAAAAQADHPEYCDNAPCWALPEFSQDALRSALPALWTHAAPLSPDATDSTGTVPNGDSEGNALDQLQLPPQVTHPLPLPDHRLWLFAGKGGVGKTTLACATALHLATVSPSSEPGRVLLLSTDPAHSVADLLQRPVSDTPAAITDGLDAACVDAETHFDRLRAEYVEEVQQFFQQAGGTRFDMPHDRQVTEHLLNLAPPGIDEMMAVTATLDRLDDSRYTHLILDMAPTGHFFRFVEMPDVFDAWIRSLFRLLRTYRRVVHAPRLNDRLVRLSKGVKALRKMLTGQDDQHAGHVYAVTMLHRMVHAETERLVNHSTHAGLSIPALFVNNIMPDSASTASVTLSEVQEDFPEQHVVQIQRGAPPLGIEALRQLGRRMYTTA